MQFKKKRTEQRSSLISIKKKNNDNNTLYKNVHIITLQDYFRKTGTVLLINL